MSSAAESDSREYILVMALGSGRSSGSPSPIGSVSSGHRVHLPELPGLDPHVDVASVDLETHVREVIDLLDDVFATRSW